MEEFIKFISSAKSKEVFYENYVMESEKLALSYIRENKLIEAKSTIDSIETVTQIINIISSKVTKESKNG